MEAFLYATSFAFIMLSSVALAAWWTAREDLKKVQDGSAREALRLTEQYNETRSALTRLQDAYRGTVAMDWHKERMREARSRWGTEKKRLEARIDKLVNHNQDLAERMAQMRVEIPGVVDDGGGVPEPAPPEPEHLGDLLEKALAGIEFEEVRAKTRAEAIRLLEQEHLPEEAVYERIFG